PGLERHGADILVDHDSLRINEECLRSTVYTPVDCGTALMVRGDDFVRIAELGEPAHCIRLLVFPIQTDDGHLSQLLDLEQRIVLCPTLITPGTPDVEHIPPPLE